MTERILSQQDLDAFRGALVAEEKSGATVEKYLRDARLCRVCAGPRRNKGADHCIQKMAGRTKLRGALHQFHTRFTEPDAEIPGLG